MIFTESIFKLPNTCMEFTALSAALAHLKFLRIGEELEIIFSHLVSVELI